MSLFDDLVTLFPELVKEDFGLGGSIELRDDSDGLGAYIDKWEYSKPIPEGFKLGK